MDRVSKQWLDAATALRDKVGVALTAAPTDRPQPLYHFTDCAGLVSILTSGTLRASLAVSVNDPSEVQYGITRARQLIGSSAITLKTLSHAHVAELLNRSLLWHVWVANY